MSSKLKGLALIGGLLASVALVYIISGAEWMNNASITRTSATGNADGEIADSVGARADSVGARGDSQKTESFDGEAIFTPQPMIAEQPPIPYALSDRYDELVRLSEAGSGAASYALFRSLERCRNVFPDTSAIASALSSFEESARIELPDHSIVNLGDSTTKEELESELLDQHRFCDGMSLAAEQGDPTPWLRASADQGYIPAVAQVGWYMRHFGFGSEAEQLHYFQQSLNAGISDGARGIFEVLSKGGADVPEDRIRAAAYLTAYVEILSQKQAHFGAGPIAEEYLANARSQLSEYVVSLSAEEAEAASRQSTGVLESARSNCCIH